MLPATLVLSLLLGQALTPPRRVPAVVEVPARDVQEAAITANDAQLLVLWTDARRREGFSWELAPQGRADLWFSRLPASSSASLGPLDAPSRLLCQAAPDQLFSGLAVTRVPGGFLAAWRVEQAGGRVRALRSARIFDDGGVLAPCGREVLALTDGGTLGPPELATSGGQVKLAWVSNGRLWHLPLSPSGGEPMMSAPAAVISSAGLVDLDFSLVGVPDGGFAVAWVERPGDGGVGSGHFAALDPVAAQVSLNAALAVRLVPVGSSLQLLVASPPNGDLKAYPVPGLSPSVTVGLSSPVQPLAASVGSSVTVIASGSWNWANFTPPALPFFTGLFSMGYEPLDMTSAGSVGLRIAARRLSDGALVALDSATAGGQPGEEVALARPPQRSTSLAWAADAGWLVGWREEGATGPGRLAVLGVNGEWAGSPVSFSNALPLLRLGSNTAGTRLAYVGVDRATGVPVSWVDALTPAGVVGPGLLQNTLAGEARLGVGDEQVLLWSRAEPTPEALHGNAGLALDWPFSGAGSVRAMGRCAAQAAGSLWLPFFDRNGALQLARQVDGTSVQSLTFVPVGVTVAADAGADLTRMRPCAAGQGNVIGITWDQGATLELALYDPTSSTALPRLSERKPGLEVFPVLAPFEGGWLVATESNESPASVIGRLVSPDLSVVRTLTLSEPNSPEARGPQLRAGPPGTVGIAWSTFNVTAGAVELRARVLLAPDGGVDWSLDGGGRDAGVDGGAADAGASDGGAVDAGSAGDAGVDGGADAGGSDGGDDGGEPSDGGGGGPPVVFQSCGCRAGDAGLVLPLAGLWVAALRRRRRELGRR